MQVEVDQSNRVDESGPTFIAASNSFTYSLKVTTSVKEAGRLALKEKGTSAKLVDPLLWSGCIFFALRPHLGLLAKESGKVIVDNEFDGYQPTIKAALVRHIRKYYGRFPVDKITIGSIGKKSSAHKKALNAKRGKQQVERTVSIAEMVNLLGK